MADQQSIITLNIGSQRVAMGVFDLTKKGELVLKSYKATSILADPMTEASRMPQVQLAIKELAQELKVKGKVCYALSGQSVLNRFVKLPPLEEENIDELVRFEAQQNFPFKIEEVIWDWQVLPGDGIEKEVILVAIKTDQLNDISEMVAETGLHTDFVDSSPTSLYNALKYNYGDAEESTLLIDVGAKSSNLVYLDGEKFFTRSVNFGGGTLTSAIAKEYDVTFAEAENSKISSGLVSMGSGHTAQLDDATAALGTLIRNSLSRLNAQISQTTTLFRSQHGGRPPQRILLAGGGANLQIGR
ncbi:MAG: pilus assembly protein PilM, partial [Verrucomicrobiales bacterium]